MTCRHVNQLRDVYLDGELSASLTAEVHAHLLQCPACQQQFEMMRACSDLIANDQAEPVLDSGFASRVVAALPKRAAPSVVMTRRDVRQRYLRIFAGAGLPAAAAMLFLSVLIWPTTPERDTIVLDSKVEVTDAVGVAPLVNQTIGGIAETQETLKNFGDAVVATVRNAGEDLEASADEPEPVSLFDVFISPFKDVLTPVEANGDESASDDTEIVRF